MYFDPSWSFFFVKDRKYGFSNIEDTAGNLDSPDICLLNVSAKEISESVIF